MTFLTPCFVRVDDATERKKIIEWCISIGYYYIEPPKEEELGTKIICDESCVGIAHDPASFTSVSCINTGASVELFKALAAMNDDNDREQWFVVDDGFEEEMVCAKSDVDYDYILSCSDYRKATAEEIVEYFKNK